MHPPPRTDPLLDDAQTAFLSPVARLLTQNPFEPASSAPIRAEQLAAMLVPAALRLAEGATATRRERAIYRGAALYALWDEYGPQLQRLIDHDGAEVPFFEDFAARYGFLLGRPGIEAPAPDHLLALLYQARRAWWFSSTKIRGSTPRAAVARASIWRAIFGADLSAYAGGLHRKMAEIPVLITGETGTGKELAAQCIAWSRYLPFDAGAKRFELRYAEDAHVRNLCEVPRDLIGSALFGHKRGSFTGAAADAVGCLSLPGPHGSLLLDEIGELPESEQVKLLRPLQGREVMAIGETRPRKIEGRLLFATHRDLEAMSREGTFRADLLERINGVGVRMPALRELIAESPVALGEYVRGFVGEMIDEPGKAEAWTARVVGCIRATRGEHRWERNLRELKNYTERYVLTDGRGMGEEAGDVVRRPAVVAGGVGPGSTELPSSGLLGPRAKAGEVTLEEITRAYVTRVHVVTGQTKAETARRLGVNWRTVARWIDPGRIARWVGRRGGGGGV